MRKILFAVSFISIGLTMLIYILLSKNKDIYPETIFTKEAQIFDKSFSKFLGSIEGNILSLQDNFADTSAIKNRKTTTDFLINYLENNPYLLSVSFIQNNYKTAIYRDKKSFVVAIDSTNVIDIVSWQRFEKNKLISSWEESFDISMQNTKWYEDLKGSNKKIQWFFNVKNDNLSEIDKDNELFYAGYSYNNLGSNCIILFRFSRFILLKEFETYDHYDNVNLFIKTSSGMELNLNAGITETFEQIDNNNANDDSLSITTLYHLERFNDLDSGVFNFYYNNSIFWNAFKRYSPNTGIMYYLLRIPNKDLVKQIESKYYTKYMFWISLFIISIGFFSLFVKKDRFVRSTRIHLPNVKEILADDENRYLEFKSSLRWDYRQEKVNPELEKVIFKTIAAFGNTDGGILLIGVDDDKNIIGLEPDFATLKKPNADFFEIHLRNMLHTLMGVKYVSEYIRMQFEKTEGKKIVCKIKVLKANEPLYIKSKNKNGQTEEKFYVRSGNSSQEIKSIAEITDYINSRFKQ